jgi:glycosyltransferase involved in cell wall biosynthesis
MIIHVIADFSAIHGAETMLARLLQIWPDEEIVVVPLKGLSERNQNLARNSRVLYCPQGAHSPLSLIGATLRLARLIREQQPRAILCWMYHAMLVGLLASRIARVEAPVFWNIRQSLDDRSSLSVSTRTALAFCRRFSALPSGLIYNSSRAQQLHQTYGYRNRNETVIPNGFELPKNVTFQDKVPRVLGIAGRFHPQKDHLTFFRAAAMTAQIHPDVHFVAAGLGLARDNPAVARLIDTAGLAPHLIDLRGEVDDMATFYSVIDALVLSSRTEGFPNVAAEAMSYGKPVITTDVGDAAVIVGDTGLIVPPGDAEALSNAMRKMLNLEPQTYASWARAARERIENKYDLPAVAERYFSFLRG